MKVTVESTKGLRILGEDVWDDIFNEAIEGVDNIVNVTSAKINDDYYYFKNNDESLDVVKELKSCLTFESLDQEVHKIKLELELKENFYDKDGNLLHAEIFVNNDLEVEPKFYYLAGNFLKTEDEKKRYSSVYEAK